MAATASPDLPAIRPGRDDDAEGLIELIGACWAEYPNCILDVDAEVPELRAIASYFARRDGRFWVADRAGRVAGCVGIAPAAEPGRVELLKLYVAADERRRGLGAILCSLVEEEAQRRGARVIELWSDSRFADAHRLYEGRGYRRDGRSRDLNDLSRTTEWYFSRRLRG
jgi:putative acetyltransferase